MTPADPSLHRAGEMVSYTPAPRPPPAADGGGRGGCLRTRGRPLYPTRARRHRWRPPFIMCTSSAPASPFAPNELVLPAYFDVFVTARALSNPTYPPSHPSSLPPTFPTSSPIPSPLPSLKRIPTDQITVLMIWVNIKKLFFLFSLLPPTKT